MFASEDQGKNVILRIVRTCRKAMRLSEVFSAEVAERGMTVFDDIYGDLEDSLYFLNQENTQELSESIVDQLLRNKDLSDEAVTDTLYQLIQAKGNKSQTTPPVRKN